MTAEALSTPETNEKSIKDNGQQPSRGEGQQRVISNPNDVAGLVLAQLNYVNNKKDELTIAIKGLAVTTLINGNGGDDSLDGRGVNGIEINGGAGNDTLRNGYLIHGNDSIDICHVDRLAASPIGSRRGPQAGDRHGWREVEQCRSNCREGLLAA
jgi:Ca2+-binding RTX toxin-like protein